MTRKDTPPDNAAQLRQQAEATARQQAAQSPETHEALSPEEIRQTLHELRVHQIELEMQNEELRRAQVELDAARARYFDLYDLAPVGYCTLNEQGLILEANLTAATLLSVPRGALVKQPISQFILRQDQDLYYLRRKQLFEAGEPQAFELRLVRKDGLPFWAQLETTSAQDADGAPVCRLVLSDITQRKQIEDVQTFLANTSRGQTYEPFFHALARYLSRSLGLNFICIDRLEGDGLTARTLAVWHDVKFEDNLAYALKGTPCGAVMDKGVCCFPAGVCQLFPDDQVLQDLRAQSYVGVTLWSHAGQPIGLIAAIGRRPLANQSQAEAILKLVAVPAAAELERLDAEAALQQTANELERSNADLQQFAYVASHDLQEPLRAVSGYVRLLQHRFPDKLDAKAIEYINGAADGAARMEKLISDLLAFSRIGTHDGEFTPADLNRLLSDALNNLQVSIKAARAKVTTDRLPTIPVHASQVTRLFQNLIGNAIKFRGERPPEIHIGARQEPGQWVLSVRDNGIGIKPEYFERIFQIFQRLHTRDKYPGTGIGLAVCKKIVERHGGTIWIDSHPAEGSTFHFSLPDSVAA